MAVVRPFVFQVSGYQNSGKTTLAEGLIRELSERGLTVCTIKHHGHGGKPDVDLKKDSARHSAAGAAATLVEGGGRLLVQAEKEAWTLDEKISMLMPLKPNIILVEGHKFASYPKIVLIRRPEDKELLGMLENIFAIAYWEEAAVDKTGIPAYPVLSEGTITLLAELIIKQGG